MEWIGKQFDKTLIETAYQALQFEDETVKQTLIEHINITAAQANRRFNWDTMTVEYTFESVLPDNLEW